ncbi:MarR family winged helix-turn-helix transcriptional regulator [Chloroflexota bacterium]
MEYERLDRVVEAMVRIPPIVHRKLHRSVLRVALGQLGSDIAPHHLMIMKALQDSEMLHSSEIAEMVAMAKPQMTHSIDKLIQLGMVERQSDIEDRRKIDIRLTQQGRDTLEKFDGIIKGHMKENLSRLSDNEMEKLAESFEYIAETFSKL